jgi:uncharacterized RDD family membrane protein YckC
MTTIITQFVGLLFQAFFAWLVWRYYKDKKYTPGHKYDTFGPRFWTGTVDACVMWPIGFVFSLLFLMSFPPVIGAALLVAQNILWLAYTVVMHGKYGQTVGKMACKVKVVDYATEGAISFLQAFLREGIPIIISLGIVAYEFFIVATGRISTEAIAKGEIVKTAAFWWLSVLPLIWFLAEIATMLTNDKRRALHDFIAGTVAIRTNLDQL